MVANLRGAKQWRNVFETPADHTFEGVTEEHAVIC